MVGYDVQTAVDTNHHMIVAHEVTNGLSRSISALIDYQRFKIG
jgi:hypothetical protein